MRMFEAADRFRAGAFLERARAVLAADATIDQLRSALDELRSWHDTFHSPNRPPYLDCTGCHVWPVIELLQAAIAAHQQSGATHVPDTSAAPAAAAPAEDCQSPPASTD